MPYQVLHHAEYLEVRLQGVIEEALDFADAEFQDGGRILLDFSEVTDVRADAYSLAEQARRGEAKGLKIAVYAPRPALFGLNRQALQLAAVHEGISAGVFLDRDAAREWLRTA